MDRDAYLQVIRQHLQHAYLLNEEKTAEMIPVFITSLRGQVERLQGLVGAGDREELGRAGHTIKGALLNMGLSDLAELAHRLERQCRDPEHEGPVDRTLITDLERAASLLADF